MLIFSQKYNFSRQFVYINLFYDLIIIMYLTTSYISKIDNQIENRSSIINIHKNYILIADLKFVPFPIISVFFYKKKEKLWILFFNEWIVIWNILLIPSPCNSLAQNLKHLSPSGITKLLERQPTVILLMARAQVYT